METLEAFLYLFIIFPLRRSCCAQVFDSEDFSGQVIIALRSREILVCIARLPEIISWILFVDSFTAILAASPCSPGAPRRNGEEYPHQLVLFLTAPPSSPALVPAGAWQCGRCGRRSSGRAPHRHRHDDGPCRAHRAGHQHRGPRHRSDLLREQKATLLCLTKHFGGEM